MNIAGVLTFSLFYPSRTVPNDSFCFLKCYPTNVIVIVLAKINAVIFQNETSDAECQLKILREDFYALNHETINTINKFVSKLGGHEQFPMVFTAQAISRLITIALSNFVEFDSNSKATAEQLQNDLFDNILLINELYYETPLKGAQLTNYDDIWKLQLLQQTYIRDRMYLFGIAPVKSFLFHQYLVSQMSEGKNYVAQFSKTFSIGSFFQHNSYFLSIIESTIDDSKRSGLTKYIIPLTAEQEKFLQPFIIHPSELCRIRFQNHIHKELIPKPFFLFESGHIVVIDFTFLSLLYDLLLIFNVYEGSTLKDQFRTFSDFKGHLGKHYYEQYLGIRMLCNIFTAKGYTVQTDASDQTFIDCAIVHNTDLYLIEIKSAELHYNVMEELNTEELKTFIRKHFLQSRETEQKNRGIHQIIKQINRLATTSELDYLSKSTKKEKINIIPIIIYTENCLDMAGVNSYINDEFRTAISDIASKFKKVQPVVLINLNFFIRYYAQLKKKPQLLKEWLVDYIKRISSVQASYKRSGEAYEYFRGNLSFAQVRQIVYHRDDFLESFAAIRRDFLE